MASRETTCCFSGHRPSKLPWGEQENDPRCLALKDELSGRLERLYQKGYRHFICGMALGCDSYFVEAVQALRELHRDVTLEAAIPCGSQSERWSRSHREKYNQLIDSCDTVTVLQYAYSPDCMMRRNKYMVDRASLLLCCFDGRPGGTMNTIVYAKRHDTEVDIIDV